MKKSAKQNNPELSSLLQQQVKNYKLMLKLETNLQEMLLTEKYQKISKNSEQKSKLMVTIESLSTQIADLIAPLLSGRDRLVDDKLELLRQEATNLIDKIQESEKQNLDALSTFRSSMLGSMKHSQTARKAARGYKRSKEIFRTNVDTKS